MPSATDNPTFRPSNDTGIAFSHTRPATRDRKPAGKRPYAAATFANRVDVTHPSTSSAKSDTASNGTAQCPVSEWKDSSLVPSAAPSFTFETNPIPEPSSCSTGPKCPMNRICSSNEKP